MQGRVPDRVPVWCLLSLEHIVRNGTPDGSIPETIEDFVMAECRLTKAYGFDGLVLYLPGIRKGENVHDELEGMIRGFSGGEPTHRLSDEDPESWEWEPLFYPGEAFYSSHLAREILGPDIHIGGWTPDGFSRTIQWFPRLDDALMTIVQDPIRFKAMIRYFDQMSIDWARAQVRLGRLESIQISSPYAGSSFISPETYREMVLPSVGRLANALKKENAFTYLHTCGFISDRLEMMAESGVDGLECLDPPPLGDVILRDGKKRVGQQIFLKGNIDSVNVLLRGSDKSVDESVMECLEVGKVGGGFILSTACSVAPAVPVERVQRLGELAARFGQYEGPSER